MNYKAIFTQDITNLSKLTEVVIGDEPAFIRPFRVKIGDQTLGYPVGQHPVEQRERREFTGKRMNHCAARSQYACAVGKERRVVIEMLDNGSRDDQVDRAFSERERWRGSVGYYLLVEVVIETQLAVRIINGDDQIGSGIFHKRKKGTFPAPTDVEDGLTQPLVYGGGDIILVDRVQMARESS